MVRFLNDVRNTAHRRWQGGYRPWTIPKVPNRAGAINAAVGVAGLAQRTAALRRYISPSALSMPTMHWDSGI